MKRWVGLWALAFGLLASFEGGPSGLLTGAVIGAILGLLLHGSLRAEIEREVQRQLEARSVRPPVQAAQAEADGLQRDVAEVDEPAIAPPMPPAVVMPREADPAVQDAPTVLAAAAEEPASLSRLAAIRAWLLGGNTVVRVGIVVLFLGLAFLAKWAADRALFPPELRLAAVGAAGIALLLTGFRLRDRAAAGYAHSLQGAGVAVMYLAVFAAFRLGYAGTLPAFALLALICALAAAIALLQNARPLAFIGFAGAYAAPLLVSSGGGNVIALFSYHLLLGVAVASIAWLRAWRELNLLGLFATFAVATAWGVLRFRPDDYLTAQLFLIGFFAVYFAATLFYALRHGLAVRQAVDGTLVFGLPILAFGLQAALTRPYEYATAFSALALAAVYLATATALLRRGEVARGLAECCTVLGLGFATLAVPLALDAAWTAAVWAVEGAAVYRLAQRQQRSVARLIGLALQGLAAGAFLLSVEGATAARWPLANPAFVGSVMLAGAAGLVAWWACPRSEDTAPAGWIERLERVMSPLLFWAGVLWWTSGWWRELGQPPYALGDGTRLHAMLVIAIGTSAAWHRVSERSGWAIAATPTWFHAPALLAGLMSSVALAAFGNRHPLAQYGWLAWPLVGAMHLHVMRRQDDGPPQRLWRWVHASHVWWLTLLVGALLVHAIDRAELWATAWATVILLVAGTTVLLVLCTPPFWHPTRWPLARHARAYTWLGAAPLAGLVLVGGVGVAVGSRGHTEPLPYVPLLNPTDLCVALALAALALWLLRLRQAQDVPAGPRGPWPWRVLAGAGFIALNTVWLRVAHHLGGVPWQADALVDSFLVQTGLSILWTALALGSMWAAHRRARGDAGDPAGWRALWMTGAVLLAVTVGKLLLVDQQNAGGGERIVAFIGVGVLMLVIGYLAPLPPKRSAA
jgi:uncharacterized membrane protein